MAIKHKTTHTHSVCALFLVFFSLSSFAQKNKYPEYCEQGSLIIKFMDEYHISPKEIDNDFSQEVYLSFIKLMDPYKLFFTQVDIDELNKFEFSLDDELNNGRCEFLGEFIPLYKKKISFADSLVNSILSNKLDFTVKEEIVFEKKFTSGYAKGNEEIKKRWNKWLKFLTLESMAKGHMFDHEKKLLKKKSLLKNEIESRDKIRSKYQNSFKSYLEDNDFYEDVMAESFYTSITKTFDPHSMYLSPGLKDYFLGALSKEEKSLGIEFEQDEFGDLLVIRLVPGGPSWKSNQINVGDLLVGIKWAKEEWLDLSFVSKDELEGMLIMNADHVILKIKKPNGKLVKVPLIKEMVRADDNVIKSFILKNEKSIGYISLPGFYTEFEGQVQLGCANDVAKAILKMQKENIEGLIIDLRNNGGGSIKEAIELSGIFIDYGPLTIAKAKDAKPITIKDVNKGTIYNDPLLILVNGKSASASEMFSATMQDYNRALIVGSQTFGKSTGQKILPLLDLSDKKIPDYLDLGFIKITTSFFYRLNQISYQRIGITPDIPIPFLSFHKEFKESDYPTALDSGRIVKKIYMPEITPLPYQELINKSKIRIANDTLFTKITSLNLAQEIDTINSKPIPLSIEDFISFKNTEKSRESDILEDIEERITSKFNISEIIYDSDVLKMDDYKKEINKFSMDQLKKDIYLEEAYLIILDLITINNK